MRHTAKYLFLIATCVVALSGCSGGSQAPDGQSGAPQSKQLSRSQKTTASPYQKVVEQLYVAYFGRPADPTGLTNFEAQLAAVNAPTDIQGLVSAYGTNVTVKALVDAFGNSSESQKLYGNSNHTTFVQAVFNNVLGRQPASAGLNFWVSALDNGSITYGDAALSIMAGALVNTTTQGLIDAQLVANRITVAIEFTTDVTTQNAVADYSGSTAAAAARSMLSQVNSTTDTSAFQTTVNSTVTALIPTVSVNNVAAVSVDSGVAGVTSVDEPFTSVTICDPANPGNCQTIDHVLVDTGSYGLRLIYDTLNPSIASALSAQGSTNVLAECTSFVDGYTWGPIRNVNFSIAGESVTNMRMQVIGDPAFAALAGDTTTICNNSGKAENTVSDFGSNGVIGVGLFQQDCGGNCELSADNGIYYSCSTTSCIGTTVSLSDQVQNPVSLFAIDNNGVVLSLPTVPQGGENTASGTLTFGVGTQSNNTMGSASVFQMDGDGYFTTTFNGTVMKQSFIDSGSNGLYFPNVTNIALCSDGFFCPSSPIELTATMSAVNQATKVNNTQNISFSIANADDAFDSPQTQNYAVYVPFGAPGQTGSFDWGLPFFFGRNVIVVTEKKTVSGNTGPFVAF